MGLVSIWHWIIVLLIIGVPAWLIIRSSRNKGVSDQLSGIGGWLGLLAFGLCGGLLRNLADFAKGLPDFKAGWDINPAARGPLAIIFGLSVLLVAANIWAIVALLQKRKSFRRAFVVLWILAALSPLSLLTLLWVPGVPIEPAAEIGRSIASICAMGLWFWYLNVSVRVRNTLVN